MLLPFQYRGLSGEGYLAFKGRATWFDFYCRDSLIPHRLRKSATLMPHRLQEANLIYFFNLACRSESRTALLKSKKMGRIHKLELTDDGPG
jgi:hypothetical protein